MDVLNGSVSLSSRCRRGSKTLSGGIFRKLNRGLNIDSQNFGTQNMGSEFFP